MEINITIHTADDERDLTVTAHSFDEAVDTLGRIERFLQEKQTLIVNPA